MINEIVELETKIAFLEKHINELSDVLYAQQKQIDELGAKYVNLKDQLTTMDQPDTEASDADERPPHY
ncbi:MAG: SlyX family protein [Cellvibrionales bacterium]|jgi:SlyX protein|nr:SlyX family protein [Cellvibrionales bacterium]MBT5922519.1 SlyX family protein [Cellvibrionales bacterium]MBT6580165.1 SlyX family protein [Cellvibrionales bacterium]